MSGYDVFYGHKKVRVIAKREGDACTWLERYMIKVEGEEFVGAITVEKLCAAAEGVVLK